MAIEVLVTPVLFPPGGGVGAVRPAPAARADWPAGDELAGRPATTSGAGLPAGGEPAGRPSLTGEPGAVRFEAGTEVLPVADTLGPPGSEGPAPCSRARLRPAASGSVLFEHPTAGRSRAAANQRHT